MRDDSARWNFKPRLSIMMYTRNRAHLFERALGSIVQACRPVAAQVQVTVSDGSDDDWTGEVVEQLLAGWPGGYRYVWNQPALDMVDNMNKAIELASGEWIQQLGDDDFLLPGAGQVMIDGHQPCPTESVDHAIRCPHRGPRRCHPAAADVP